MALKKTIASSFVNGHVVIPQRDVEMHPFEEAATLARWAIHDEVIKVPPKPTIEDEHEMLLSEGADAVKTARIVWQAAFDAAQPSILKAQEAFQAADTIWCKHAELCVANGLDPDTYPDSNKLTMPIKETENAIS